MSDTSVWGLLPKAQDNAQTIDEAITAAIAAHNDDPDSHMAAGQSIDVHRVNSIIDHPAGSVLSDKTTSREFVLQDSFSSLDNWNTVNATKLTGNYKLGFYATNNTLAQAVLNSGILFLNDADFGTKEIVFQFALAGYIGDAGNYMEMGAGTYYGGSTSAGLGVKITSTQIRLFEDALGTRYWGIAQTYDIGTLHTLRIHLDPVAGKITLEIDSSLVDSIDIVAGDASDPSDAFDVSIHKGTGSTINAGMDFMCLYFSQAA